MPRKSKKSQEVASQVVVPQVPKPEDSALRAVELCFNLIESHTPFARRNEAHQALTFLSALAQQIAPKESSDA